MLELSRRSRLTILSILTLLMLLTRSSHSISLEILPNASWAIFFILGFYVRNISWFVFFIVQALLVDIVAVTWGGVDNFCVSPAYPFLLPAYAALWLSGRWYASHYTPAWSTFAAFTISVISGALVCELLSSGGFYFFSGRFSDVTIAGFADRLVTYFPPFLGNMLFYVVIAALLHMAMALTKSGRVKTKPTQ